MKLEVFNHKTGIPWLQFNVDDAGGSTDSEHPMVQGFQRHGRDLRTLDGWSNGYNGIRLVQLDKAENFGVVHPYQLLKYSESPVSESDPSGLRTVELESADDRPS